MRRRERPEDFLVLLANGSHDKRRCGCGGCEDFRAKYRDDIAEPDADVDE